MTAAQLGDLLHRISGGHVAAFFLVLARLVPMFVLAPLFSSRMVPARVRGTIAVALAIGLTGFATRGQHVPTEPLALCGLMLMQLLVGFGFAFALSALFAGVEAAGAISDAVAGFSFGSLIDPAFGNQGGTLTQLYSIAGLAIFIAIGGDAWMLQGLTRTFHLVPLTHAPNLRLEVAGAVAAFASIFVSALEVAAPALLALLITDVAFGLVSRVVPQLNVFAVGFPFKVVVALLIATATLPFLGGWMSDQIGSSVTSALAALHVA